MTSIHERPCSSAAWAPSPRGARPLKRIVSISPPCSSSRLNASSIGCCSWMVGIRSVPVDVDSAAPTAALTFSRWHLVEVVGGPDLDDGAVQLVTGKTGVFVQLLAPHREFGWVRRVGSTGGAAEVE